MSSTARSVTDTRSATSASSRSSPTQWDSTCRFVPPAHCPAHRCRPPPCRRGRLGTRRPASKRRGHRDGAGQADRHRYQRHVAAVELANHECIDADAVVVGPRFRAHAEPLAALGLRPAPHPTGLGDFVETDTTGATTVPGVYAAGSLTDPSQQVLQAAADGSRVGAMISFNLAHDDIQAANRPSAIKPIGILATGTTRYGVGIRTAPSSKRSVASPLAAPSTSAPAKAATRYGWPSRDGA